MTTLEGFNKAESEAVRMLKLRYGSELEPSLYRSLEQRDIQTLAHHDHWAVRAAGLVLAREQLREKRADFSTCAKACFDNLEHEQVRTRVETIDLLLVLTLTDKVATWNQFGAALLDTARRNIALDLEERGLEAERNGMKETKQEDEERDVIPDLRLPIELEISRTRKYSVVDWSDFRGRVRANSSGASARIRLDSGAIVLMVHETVGWKALETSLKGLNAIVRNYGPDFVSHGHLTADLVSLFDEVLVHENRFVREVGLNLAETLARITFSAGQASLSKEHKAVRIELYHSIAEGMCDNNSQVRFAACNAAKALVETRPPGAEIEATESVLAPVICLNRHYNADGIRSTCLQAWRTCFPQNGPAVIAARIDTFIEVYLAEMKGSKDDLCREACCYALGELATKVNVPALESGAVEIVVALQARFKDASWSVRAAACNACASYVSAFPNLLQSECEGKLMDALLECLTDPIWSVRDEAAVSLSTLARSFPATLKSRLLSTVKERLPRAREHDEKHHKGHHNCNTIEDDDAGVQMVFSCCSAEPNIHFDKLPKREWQYSDGAVRLLRELSVLDPVSVDSSGVLSDFARLVEGLRFHHGAKNSMLEETAMSVLPAIAQALGKRPFKRYLDQMIPQIIKTLVSDRHKAAHASSIACDFLRKYLGEGIFKARVEAFDPSYWEDIEENPPSKFEAIHVSFKM